jgi:hypothetical protein
MDDALTRIVEVEQANVVPWRVVAERRGKRRAFRVGVIATPGPRRNDVIVHGDRQLGGTHSPSPPMQHRECPLRDELMQHMPIDVQHRRTVILPKDNVLLPDLFE